MEPIRFVGAIESWHGIEPDHLNKNIFQKSHNNSSNKSKIKQNKGIKDEIFIFPSVKSVDFDQLIEVHTQI